MKTDAHRERPDYRETVARLKQCAPRFTSTANLTQEAADIIEDLMETNRQLNRRLTTGSDEREIERLRSKIEKSQRSAKQGWSAYSATFSRMMSSHDELKIIYEHIRRALPDGCDNYGYHSVMDSRVDGGEQEPGTVWANRYKSRRGGVVSIRPAEAIVKLVDELLRLREAHPPGEDKDPLTLIQHEANFLRERAHAVVKHGEEGHYLDLRREYQDHADRLDQIVEILKFKRKDTSCPPSA